MTIDAAERPRILALDGGFNLRDLGGYATADGGQVKRGVLYRSGSMARLSDAAAAELRALGIRTVCDLRRSDERANEPTRWHESAADTRYWFPPQDVHSGSLADLAGEGPITADSMRAAMVRLYRELPGDHAGSYRFLFERLLAGDVPLLFNCAAGKDRTGVAAVLVLHALGVPLATILEDYLLTNQADFAQLLAGREGHLSRWATLDSAALAPVLEAAPGYLDALYAGLDERYGGIDAYLADVLDVGAAERARLQSALVER